MNAGDTSLGAHQRLYSDQRARHRAQATPEVPVLAGDLVEGGAIRRREGGFVDYLCLVLDAHEIVFAEGISTESLPVTGATLNPLPEMLASDLRARNPALSHRPGGGAAR